MFKLSLKLSEAIVDSVKSALTNMLPEIKSSHRCEAMARGFGFNTYAALRTNLKKPTPTTALVSPDFFVRYLEQKGFQASVKPLYHAAAYAAIVQVMEQVPRLTMGGIGVGSPRYTNGRWETTQEMNEKFVADRKALLDYDYLESFLLALTFVSRVEPTKTIRQGTGSYRLKHVAEKYACTYPEGDRLGPQYITNGTFIAAAIHAGFRIKTHLQWTGYADLNVTFNMPKRVLDILDRTIRPDGARAQEWERRIEAKLAKQRHVYL